MSFPNEALLKHDVDRNLGAELFQSVRDIRAGKDNVAYLVGLKDTEIQLTHESGSYRGKVNLRFGSFGFQGEDIEALQRDFVNSLQIFLEGCHEQGIKPVLDVLIASLAQSKLETEEDLEVLMDLFDVVLDAGGNKAGSPLKFLSQYLQNRVRQWETKNLNPLPGQHNDPGNVREQNP